MQLYWYFKNPNVVMNACLTDTFNFFIIVPHYLLQFFLLVLSSYLLNFFMQ